MEFSLYKCTKSDVKNKELKIEHMGNKPGTQSTMYNGITTDLNGLYD